MKRAAAIMLTTLFTLFALKVSAGTQPIKYERKSISYLDVLLVTSPSARKMSEKERRILLDKVREYIELDRFDYNPLPQDIISDFLREAKQRERSKGKLGLTVDEVARIMEQTLVPHIEKILKATAGIRAAEGMDESQRQGFLATKAKELGYTLEDLERVYNAAYIYAPVVTGLSITNTKRGGKRVSLTGGIIWFHVRYEGDRPIVEPVVVKSTASWACGESRQAYQAMAMNFARNLQTLTREIPEFQLQAQVMEVDGGKVGFKLGTKEGVKLDEVYWVGSWRESPNGTDRFEKSGWARISQVGDDRNRPDAYSYATAVKLGDWYQGMTVLEYPRLGMDIAVKPGLFKTSISGGSVPVLTDRIIIEKTSTTFSPGLDLDIHTNLANITGVRQLFFVLGGNFVYPTITARSEHEDLFTDLTTSAYVWGLHGGLNKKLYFRQLAVGIEGKAGIRFFAVTQNFSDLSHSYKFTMKNNTIGGQLNIDVSWAFTPAINLGVLAGYRVYAVSDVWDASLEQTDTGDKLTLPLFNAGDSYPEINHSGPVFGIYFHFTPGTLPFDPIQFIRGAISGKC